MHRITQISAGGMLLFLFFTQLSFSQEQEYNFRHLTTEDGLPINFSWQVLKDSRGIIWITTRAGSFTTASMEKTR